MASTVVLLKTHARITRQTKASGVRVSVNNNENGGAILTTLGQHKMCNLHIDERDVRNHPHSTIPPPPSAARASVPLSLSPLVSHRRCWRARGTLDSHKVRREDELDTLAFDPKLGLPVAEKVAKVDVKQLTRPGKGARSLISMRRANIHR
jgi:hypothetical protein